MKQEIIHSSGLRVAELGNSEIQVAPFNLVEVVQALKGKGGVGEATIEMERNGDTQKMRVAVSWDERNK